MQNSLGTCDSLLENVPGNGDVLVSTERRDTGRSRLHALWRHASVGAPSAGRGMAAASKRGDTVSEETAHALVRAMDEARTAKRRLVARARNTCNDRAVRPAWMHALRAGPTEAELNASGLTLGNGAR